ncbi:MAG: CoA transferase [Acidimicrobiales bacterium]
MGGLSHLRVIEVAGGVGAAYAAKLFADLGADVIRVEARDHDLVRQRPHEAHRWLNTNKRSVFADAGVLDGLLDGADLVIHDLGPTAAGGAGLDADRLLARHPSLVVGSCTPYGHTGPWADHPGTELTMIHASSWGNLSPAAAPDTEHAPIKAPGHHATLMTAIVAAAAFLAAVDRARRSGLGEHVDFSALGAAAKVCETSPAGATFQGNDASRAGVRSLMPWGIYECRDGLLQFICVEDAQWNNLVKLMGSPEWATMEVFADAAGRRENADLLQLYLSEWMATQSAAELFVVGQEHRLCMAPVYRMDQLVEDRQLQGRGFFVTDPDGRTQPGPGYRFDQPWWALRRSAPAAGEHSGAGWAERAAVPAPTEAPDPTRRPLEGLRVCDFTWIWAGPYCTQLLAHLGAEVVRLESPEYLCLFRRMPFHPPGVAATPDSDGLFQLYNSDKRSLAIDLRNDAAREIINRLVANSDVVVENFAAGTLAALGYGVEDLRAINPDIIVVSLSGFGQDGPYAQYMAYGPSGGAFAGLYAANGFEGGRAAETGIAIGDPGTGLTAAWATVVAVAARRAHGVAARIDVAMVEAIAATVGELWMQYDATGRAPGPVGNKDPQWAPHGVYATGPDEWLAIACTDDAAYRALVGVVAATGADDLAATLGEERFATMAGRKVAEADLDAALAAWTAGRDRAALHAALVGAGVAAAPSLSPLQVWGGDRLDPATTAHGNEQLEAIGMLERPEHPVTGARTVPGVPWRLRNGPNGLRRPAPLLGQHTDEVLAELASTTPRWRRWRRAALPGRTPEPA